jgi:hypothetical protein
VTDVNGDRVIDSIDLQALLDAWREDDCCGYDPRVDYDESGLVDNADLQVLLETWANHCQP